jgi:hypothetical protein
MGVVIENDLRTASPNRGVLLTAFSQLPMALATLEEMEAASVQTATTQTVTTITPPLAIEEVVAPPAIKQRPQLSISDTELRARVSWDHRNSPHFVVTFDRTRFQPHEVTTAIGLLEESYSAIFAQTHESFVDRFQIYLIDRQSTALLGRKVAAHISLEERSIYLVRSSSQTAYSELLHLLTHAMRMNRYRKHYGITPGWSLLEDAFSVFLQQRLSVSEYVFPFYAVEPDIVAFHVLRKYNRPGVSSSWTSSTSLDDFNRYIVGGAFMLYLGDSYSDDRIVELSKSEEPVTSETFKNFFGKTLEQLEARWLEHLPTSLMTLTHEEHTYALARWEQSFEARG